MSTMWMLDTNLSDMQNDIKKIIVNKMGVNVLMSNVIILAREDYLLLEDKIKNISTADELEKYSLAIITGYVESYRYHREDVYSKIYKNLSRHLPQHQTKYVLENIASTLYDYHIDNFGCALYSYSDIKKVILKHIA